MARKIIMSLSFFYDQCSQNPWAPNTIYIFIYLNVRMQRDVDILGISLVSIFKCHS